MADEEKAEEYADKILSDSKYPFIFSKEKVKAYIIKVYSDSLKCCENAYNKGLEEGRKEGYAQGEQMLMASGEVVKKGFLDKLEKENAKLSNSVLEFSNSVIELTNSVTELENKITELEKQIGKMKDCRNCKHYGNYKDDYMCVLVGQKIHCKNKDKWELAE